MDESSLVVLSLEDAEYPTGREERISFSREWMQNLFKFLVLPGLVRR